MTLTKRERLLVFGSIIVVIMLVHWFFVVPYFKNVNSELTDQEQALKSELEAQKKIADSLEELESNIAALDSYLAETLQDYYGTEFKQEHILMTLRDFVDENGIKPQQVAFYDDQTDNFKGQLEKHYSEQQAKAAVEGESSDDGDSSGPLPKTANELAQEKADEYGIESEKLVNPAKVQKLTNQPLTSPGLRITKVDVKFETDYAKVMKLIAAISHNPKKIGLETIILKANPEDENEEDREQLTCNLVMFVPALDLVENYYPTPASPLEEPLITPLEVEDPFVRPSWYETEMKDPTKTIDTPDDSEPSTDD